MSRRSLSSERCRTDAVRITAIAAIAKTSIATLHRFAVRRASVVPELTVSPSA
jgi:hypothetical protein